jgi:hypothetical protein
MPVLVHSSKCLIGEWKDPHTSETDCSSFLWDGCTKTQSHTRSRKPKKASELGAPIPAMVHWLNILDADHFSPDPRVLPMRASASEIPTTGITAASGAAMVRSMVTRSVTPRRALANERYALSVVR